MRRQCSLLGVLFMLLFIVSGNTQNGKELIVHVENANFNFHSCMKFSLMHRMEHMKVISFSPSKLLLTEIYTDCRMFIFSVKSPCLQEANTSTL
jgi:hypothetical protein